MRMKWASIPLMIAALAFVLYVGGIDRRERIARYPCSLDSEGRCNGPLSMMPTGKLPQPGDNWYSWTSGTLSVLPRQLLPN